MYRHKSAIIVGSLLLLSVTFFVSSAGTLGLTVERARVPDQGAIATLASLMLEGTRYSQKATELANPPTPTAAMASIQGKICYPSGRTPEMTAYFMNNTLRRQFEVPIAENQNDYSIQLPPGQYFAWAIAPQYQIGGYYSRFVACGMTEECTDHSQLLFNVQAGETVVGIDICDWPHPLPTDIYSSPR